jgi:phosphatidylglycerophosphate synthase
MPAYQPTSRRPIADIFRKTAQAATRLCVSTGVSPDAISYASVAFAGFGALCFWKSSAQPWLLLIAPGFCYLRLWCNMLDGMVALAAAKASWRGEILNDLPDRISDVVIFAGVAHSGWTHPLLGYWAAIFALLTAYVGTLGQAVGARRQFAGVMSKPWRMVMLHIGAWITLADAGVRFAGLTIFDWTCIIVILGCVQTIAVRLRRTFAELRAKTVSR